VPHCFSIRHSELVSKGAEIYNCDFAVNAGLFNTTSGRQVCRSESLLRVTAAFDRSSPFWSFLPTVSRAPLSPALPACARRMLRRLYQRRPSHTTAEAPQRSLWHPHRWNHRRGLLVVVLSPRVQTRRCPYLLFLLIPRSGGLRHWRAGYPWCW